jgi:hypothetical protein
MKNGDEALRPRLAKIHWIYQSQENETDGLIRTVVLLFRSYLHPAQ